MSSRALCVAAVVWAAGCSTSGKIKSTTGSGSSTGGGTTSGGVVRNCDAGCGEGYRCQSGDCLSEGCQGIPEGQGCALGALPDAGSGACCGQTCDALNAFETDPSNCGACGQLCPSHATCVAGNCLIDGGEVECSPSVVCPSGATCYDGICIASSCAGAAEGAPCLFSVGVQGACCAGACANVAYDSANCAVCDIGCGPGAFCDDYSCAPTPNCADAGGADCPFSSATPGSCCAGSCVDIEHDPNNCDECGFGCPTGDLCQYACLGPDGGYELYCDELSDGGCPAGHMCVSDACVVDSCGSVDGVLCGIDAGVLESGGTCCNSACTNSDFDSANCGACGKVCDAGSFCRYGECAPFVGCLPDAGGAYCPVNGQVTGVCCGSTCSDPSSDARNCDGCGQACATGETCMQSSCMFDGGYAGCNSQSCPTGTICVDEDLCLAASCTGVPDTTHCALDSQTEGECCGQACINLAQNSQSCGHCGGVCATGTFCSNGACLPVTNCADAGADTICPVDATHSGYCCAGGCKAEDSDPANCGGCGAVCPLATICLGSECQLADGGGYVGCYSGVCPTGTTCTSSICALPSCEGQLDGLDCVLPDESRGTCCDQMCLDVSADADNCGGCGNVCPAGDLCEGACEPYLACSADGGTTLCPLSRTLNGTCCGDTCVDLSSNASDCSGCGLACPSTASCQDYSCEIDGGAVSCEVFGCPAGTACGDSSVCAPISCSGLADSSYCAFGDGTLGFCCSGSCVGTSDPQNCGSCGRVCAQGTFCADDSCEAVPDCGDAGGIACPLSGGGTGTCCGGACHDLTGDSRNCGACGYVCEVGATCQAEECMIDGGYAYCNAGACPAGTTCLGYECAAAACAGLSDGVTCALSGQVGGVCCNQTCVNPNFDSSNCGTCGVSCGVGGFCEYEQCKPFAGCAADGGPGVSCPFSAGQLGTCCGTSCVSLNTDPANCGGCGELCTAGASCDDQSCEIDGGFAYCSDTSGCPAGTVCTENYRCIASSCTGHPDLDACALADGQLDGFCCGGACLDTGQDSANCGACGVVCAAGTFCSESTCLTVPNCADAGVNTGCPFSETAQGLCCGGSCVLSSGDASNCGACGDECAAANVCLAGECTLADGGGVVGCSSATCPSGTVCEGVVCVRSSCVGQADGLTCNSGAGEGVCCGQQCTLVETDSNDCGGCGVVCAPGTFCNYSYCYPDVTCTVDGGTQTCAVSATEVGLCCGASCTDIQSDPFNCGNCGLGCDLFHVCVAGNCQEIDAGSAGCAGDGGCPAGLECVNSIWCVTPDCAGRTDGIDCYDPGAKETFGKCCAGTCIDPAADSADCGSCGTSCPAGTFCYYSGCSPTPNCADAGPVGCPVSRTDFGSCCDQTCVDLDNDATHCAVCGLSCVEGASCVDGDCINDGGSDWCYQGGTCPPGTSCGSLFCARDSCAGAQDGDDCDIDGGYNGARCCGQTCVNVYGDSNNCGACGVPCAGTCTFGSCQ